MSSRYWWWRTSFVAAMSEVRLRRGVGRERRVHAGPVRRRAAGVAEHDLALQELEAVRCAHRPEAGPAVRVAFRRQVVLHGDLAAVGAQLELGLQEPTDKGVVPPRRDGGGVAL